MFAISPIVLLILALTTGTATAVKVGQDPEFSTVETSVKSHDSANEPDQESSSSPSTAVQPEEQAPFDPQDLDLRPIDPEKA